MSLPTRSSALGSSALSAAPRHPLRSSVRPFHQGQKLQKQKTVRRQQSSVVTEAAFGGGSRTKAPTTSYICKDCGYIYDERQSFESLDKSYRCPVCNAPKKRFVVYNEPVSRGANKQSTRKDRKDEMQAGGGGGLNPGIVLGAGGLLALGAIAYALTQV